MKSEVDGWIYSNNQLLKQLNITDSIIWRYFDLPKFINLIMDSSLFFARANVFPDKREGTLNELSKVLMLEEVQERTKDVPFVVHNLYKDNPEKYIEFLRENTYITCWTLNDEESNLMWSSYAPDEYGIAIKTTTERLRKSYKILEKEDIYNAKIKYIDFENDVIPTKFPLIPFLVKSKGYTDEKEFRAFFQEFHNEKFQKEQIQRDNLGVKIPIDLNTLIDEIVVKRDMPNWFYQTIEKLIDNVGLTKRIRISSLYF